MGVRGLTTYIARNAELYMKPFELHDCNLVIDGDNLASQIYRWVGNCNAAFGGDYDYYFQLVVDVFKMFLQCNVSPYVIVDGGYEMKKIKTVKSRFRKKIASIKHINPHDCKTTFPLMMREVFLDAVKACGVPVMRCIFEADDEIAVLAKKLDCPVLSYDSDFFIHNVKYIPISSVTFSLHKRILSDKEDYKVELHCKRKDKKKKQRKIKLEEPANSEPESFYFFLDCCIYETKNIAAKEFRNFNPEMLPLFGALLGNDYIEKRLLRNFYQQVSVGGRGGGGPNLIKRRIYAIIQWLKNETPESAIKKLLGHIKTGKRAALMKNIETAMSGYKREYCEAFEYFGFNSAENCIESTDDKEIDFTRFDLESETPSFKEDQLGDDSEESEVYEDSDIQSIADEATDSLEDGTYTYTVDDFPKWFRVRFIRGEMSRFFVNLFSLHLFISVPQIEDYNHPDSNLISKDILMFMFSLIHHPKTPVLNYMTRNLKGHAVVYHKFEAISLPDDLIYDPNVRKNEKLFKYIFRNFEKCDEFLNELQMFPENIHLYLMAIYYWGLSSKVTNSAHIQSIVLCLVYLTTQSGSQKKYFFTDIPNSEKTTLRKKFYSYFTVTDKVKSRHGAVTYGVLHPLAEFQSVVFNLNNLNALLNYPYCTINIQEYFNGIFIYNMYMNLKGRNDIGHYITNYFCENCPTVLAYYNLMCNFVKTIVPTLNFPNIRKRVPMKIMGASVAKPRRKKIIIDSSEEDDDIVTANVHDDSDSDFNDVNNKFSILLKI